MAFEELARWAASTVVEAADAAEVAEVADKEIGWVQQWRDLGPGVWLVATAAWAAWWLLVALHAWRVKPRRVRPGPDALDLVGDEPPALVNLVTSRWSPGPEAVPATLLDLAARRFISIRGTGDDTVVHAPAADRSPAGADDEDTLRPYEQMVLEHVRGRAEKSPQRIVPVGALVSGPSAHKLSETRFLRAVSGDAERRGLARRRWTVRRKLFLFFLALVPSAVAGFALSSLVYGGRTDTDGDLVYGGIVYAVVVSIGAAVIVAGGLRGVADTDEGREVAARWLGLRTMLADNPLFAEQHASDAESWGRKLAYGAAMGVAPGPVRELRLRRNSDRELWSPVGGSWRKVKVRYGRGGDGPGVAIGTGVVFTLLAVAVLMPMSTFVLSDGPGGSSVATTPFLVVMAPFAVLVLLGTVNVARGVLDLISAPRPVGGQVVLVREKTSGKSRRWDVVVDDGDGDRIRAWGFPTAPPVVVGDVVEAHMSRYLRRITDLRVVRPAKAKADGSGPDSTSGAGPTPYPEGDGDAEPISGLSDVPVVNHGVMVALRNAEPSGPFPPWPTDEAVSDVLGLKVTAAPGVPTDVTVLPGQTVRYRGAGALVHVAWIDDTAFRRCRRPRFLARSVPDVGDDAFLLWGAGALLARRDDAVVIVAAHLPERDKNERVRVTAALARMCLTPAVPAADVGGMTEP